MPDSVCGAGAASRRQEYTDVAIIGAGPAGATLARRLAETTNYRVTLLDRRALDRPQQGVGKCCGGLLAPDAQRSLARQGLILPLEILVDPQIFAVRTIDLHLPEEHVGVGVGVVSGATSFSSTMLLFQSSYSVSSCSTFDPSRELYDSSLEMRL